jgi:hypothetical protein
MYTSRARHDDRIRLADAVPFGFVEAVVVVYARQRRVAPATRHAPPREPAAPCRLTYRALVSRRLAMQ